MEEKKKHKSGYSILRAKLAKKEEEITELKNQLSIANNKLNGKGASFWRSRSDWFEARNKLLQDNLEKAISQMGWLRRFIYGYY